MNRIPIALTVNGVRHEAEVESRLLLVDFVREHLDLVGVHIGCEHGVCGTCTVLMNGESIRSCITFAVQADGAELTTVESLAQGATLHPLQEAFWEKQGLQCGYCTPGMLLRSLELLRENPQPSADQVREAISEQPVPLYRLSVHHRVGAGSGRADAGIAMATTQHPPTRDLSGERKWVGKSIRRIEDPKFLRGRGNYIDDMRVPGMLHAALVRSPHAHARILSIDAEDTRQLPGVFAVVTGAQAAELTDPLPDFGPAADKHVWRCLAVDKVRYVGEGVAAIVAESRYVAEDAADLVEVEYEQLDPVVDPEAALEPDAAIIHDLLGTNLAYERTFTFGDVDRDFAEADLVVSDRLRWHRSGGQPLETVGAIATYEVGSGMMTIQTNSLSFTSYLFMLAGTLKIPPNRLDMQPHPAGGSFGTKLFATKVSAIAGMLSKLVGRPVKYVEDRIDNISNCDHHGSDRVDYADLALMRDGTLKSLRVHTVDDYGAYIQFGVGHHGNALAQATGPYHIGSLEYGVKAVLTNKCQQGAYRGFGSEVHNWMLERMVDLAARELNMDPAWTRPRSAAPTSSARRSSPASSRPETYTTAATTRACSTRHWRWPITKAAARCSARRARRVATWGSAWSPARSAACSARPSSGSGSTSPRRRSRRCRRASR
jgi:CO/xanthine dehydrogenase Mo-binding subunit/aerobic-type carbon monoxide dehydrogenase small subunit (CoxS/CutS family)